MLKKQNVLSSVKLVLFPLTLLLIFSVQSFGQIDPSSPTSTPASAPVVPTIQEVSLPSGMTFVSIASGTFRMGSSSGESNRDSDESRHSVCVSSFELMSTEVTQGMWEEVMGTNPRSGYGVGSNYPVYNVSWNDCQEFIEKLNDLDPSHTYRLPTEAEWEYACRAGTSTAYYWGNGLSENTMGGYYWYTENSNLTTHPVGTKTPNAWSLYDMSGNVYEWCQDVYTSDYSDCPTDGSAYSGQGSYRVLRGGCWYSDARYCRSARRVLRSPGLRFSFIGFRLARSTFPPAPAPVVPTIQEVSLPSGMTFVSIASGTFQMGSPSSESDRSSDESRHSVHVSSFELMSTEVTQGMWEEVMGEDIRDLRDSVNSCWSLRGEGSNYPVYYVSWGDCQDFIEKLNDLDPSYTYRLPTEAEWEYACRAGTSTAYYWGNSSSESTMKQYCWYEKNANDGRWSTPHASREGTQSVGTKSPNAWGLYDMSGNVYEWCQDIYTSDYSYCPTDGSAYTYSGQGSDRVFRGGSWDGYFASFCRSADRFSSFAGDRNYHLGLRLARS